MSVIRRYGNMVINLTKIISVEQYHKTLEFRIPLSNYFNGTFVLFEDPERNKAYFSSVEEAQKELKNIQDILNGYHKDSRV